VSLLVPEPPASPPHAPAVARAAHTKLQRHDPEIAVTVRCIVLLLLGKATVFERD